MEEKITEAVRNFALSLSLHSHTEQAMFLLTELTSQLPLSNFNHWECIIRSEFSLAQIKLTPPKWKFWIKNNESSSWLDLVSWDGYKREQALRTITTAAPNAFFFSLAVRRLNDWVPEVRTAARERLTSIAKITNPEYVVDTLVITLANWISWGRIQESDKQVLLEIISEDVIADLLNKRLIYSISGPQPTLFSQLGRSQILDTNMIEIARHATQPAVRAKAYRCLFDNKIVWLDGWKWKWTDLYACQGRLNPILGERALENKIPLTDLLNLSAQDRSSVVRRIAAEILIRDLDKLAPIARKLAEQFAADKSNPVAERGRFALKLLDAPHDHHTF